MTSRNQGLSQDELVLRDVTESDLPVLFDQQLDPEAARMAAFPSRDWEAFVAHWTKVLSDQTALKKTIVVDGQVAGNVGSWGESGEREVGYWIGRDYWGRGVATRALAAFLRHERTRPLQAHVAKHNIASIRVLEKCGFSISGEDKSSFQAGEEVEEFIFELRDQPSII